LRRYFIHEEAVKLFFAASSFLENQRQPVELVVSGITGGLITIKGSPYEKSAEIMQNKVKTGENKTFFAPASIFCSFSQIIGLDNHY
jgi:hypothetical protein